MVFVLRCFSEPYLPSICYPEWRIQITLVIFTPPFTPFTIQHPPTTLHLTLHCQYLWRTEYITTRQYRAASQPTHCDCSYAYVSIITSPHGTLPLHLANLNSEYASVYDPDPYSGWPPQLHPCPNYYWSNTCGTSNTWSLFRTYWWGHGTWPDM